MTLTKALNYLTDDDTIEFVSTVHVVDCDESSNPDDNVQHTHITGSLMMNNSTTLEFLSDRAFNENCEKIPANLSILLENNRNGSMIATEVIVMVYSNQQRIQVIDGNESITVMKEIITNGDTISHPKFRFEIWIEPSDWGNAGREGEDLPFVETIYGLYGRSEAELLVAHSTAAMLGIDPTQMTLISAAAKLIEEREYWTGDRKSFRAYATHNIHSICMKYEKEIDFLFSHTRNLDPDALKIATVFKNTNVQDWVMLDRNNIDVFKSTTALIKSVGFVASILFIAKGFMEKGDTYNLDRLGVLIDDIVCGNYDTNEAAAAIYAFKLYNDKNFKAGNGAEKRQNNTYIGTSYAIYRYLHQSDVRANELKKFMPHPLKQLDRARPQITMVFGTKAMIVKQVSGWRLIDSSELGDVIPTGPISFLTPPEAESTEGRWDILNPGCGKNNNPNKGPKKTRRENADICRRYALGETSLALAKEFRLSPRQIQRITSGSLN